MTGPANDVEGALRGDCPLHRIAHLATLPAETLDELAAICRVRSFRSGQTVVSIGETPGFIGCVLDGVLRMQKTSHDGREHIVGLLVEGDMFGRLFDGPMNLAIEAATDAEVCVFQRAAFEALILRSRALDRAILLNILNELDRARDWMIILATPKVTGKLAAFLLFLCSRFARVDHLLRLANGNLEVKIPISRADLANLLGSRQETISRAFHMLARDGYISIKRPNLIEIRDLDGLASEMGDEDYFEIVSLKKLARLLQERNDADG